MKAITKYKYGGPEVLRLEEIEKPTIKSNEVLVQVKANSVNPADWHIMRGKPRFARLSFGLFKPKKKILGADFAGIVEDIGEQVKDFKKGDRIYGESLQAGVFAQYANVKHDICAKIPEGLSFKEMACIPIAGLTALQSLLEHGELRKGEKVLINGSSGGVGHFAVQIAHSIGADVTAICSQKNTAFVESLGADQVLAYDKIDIHSHEGKYDLVVDNHGNLKHSDYKRMGKRGVMVGFVNMKLMMGLMFRKMFSKFPLKTFTADANTKDLEKLAQMVANGEIKVHIDRSFSYQEIPDAINYIEAMRTRGKVAMTWE